MVAGIAYDGSAVYRKGAAQAPGEIRRLSPVMPPVTESGTALVELGLHDLGDLEELDFVGRNGLLMLQIARVAADPRAAGEAIADAVGTRPLHISFDIDVLDPAFAPGTEIASAGGLSTRQALELMGAVAARCRLVGLDVEEVSPPLDHADITSLAALKILFEFWGMAWKPRT